jgi:hydroxymethylbilane synthase
MRPAKATSDCPTEIMPRLTYATRRSALALAQCRAFVRTLQAHHLDLELHELLVVTTGDRIQDRPLSDIGGKGLFVKEIEEALLASKADLAVHSIKDVPAVLPEGLAIACVPPREDPRDVLVSPRHRTLADLPERARVGTSSLRRKLSLLTLRPDLDVAPIRGNVDTRLRKLDEGEFDAIVLAGAGLRRLGLEGRATEVFSVAMSLPAIGQGALGIEIRSEDAVTRALLAPLHHAETAVCVAAERGVLLALDGDCKTPIAAHAERTGASMRLRAFVSEPDGSRVRKGERRIPWPISEQEGTNAGLSLGRELV